MNATHTIAGPSSMSLQFTKAAAAVRAVVSVVFVIRKRRPVPIGILTQQPTDNLDRTLLGQRALNLILNFHNATIIAPHKVVQRYLWALGRASRS